VSETAMRTRERGFTLVEILIVVLVIAILLSLLMPALAHLRRKGRIVATNELMQQLATALTDYMDRYPSLGDPALPDPSSDFKDQPWKFLYINWVKNLKEEPKLQLQVKLLTTGGAAYAPATSLNDGERILDYFPNGAHTNALWFDVKNEPVAGFTNRFATTEVRIYSSAGTLNDRRDDIIWEYTKKTGEWYAIAKGR
jgi:prepilin-type N-terminal cleavage/methylation domain-containing protein